jgi:hypothetical protein
VPSCDFAARKSRIDMPLGKGGMSDTSERMQEKVRTEADVGVRMCIRLLD